MTDIIIHKHSITAGDAPEPAELDLGELAIQAADGHIYLKKTDGTVNRVTMLPGGDTQQVLYKTGAGDYALGWGTITSTLMGGALWSEVVAEVQRVFALVEGTASVLLSASATLTAGSTGPITVSVADSSYLTDGTSITGVLGTVYGTLSRSGSSYSFESVQSYTSNVTFAMGTRFAAAFLNDTFNPLRIGSAEVEDDSSYADGSGYSHVVVDSSGRIGYGVKNDGAFDVPSGNINLDDAKIQDADSYTDGSGYVRVEVDENGRIAWGIKNDGTVAIKKALVEGNSTVQGNNTVQGNGIFESDVTIQGDLTVQGTTVTIDVTDLTIEDSTILLNKGESGSGVTLGSAGIEIDRGTADNVKFEWTEANQAWTAEESIRTNSSVFISGSSSEKDNSYTEGSGYYQAVLDSSDRIGYGLKDDGSFDINGAVATKKDKTYDAYVQVELDSNNRISRAILPSGQQYFPKADFDELTIQGQSLSANVDVRAQVSGDSAKGIDYDQSTGVFSSPDGHANRIIVKWGDSISADISNTTVLEQLESGRQMLTRSTGGIDNGSILARFGAIPVTGRIYWDVKTVTVVSQTDNTIQLTAGGASSVEVGDYFRGANLNVDMVITSVNTGTDQIQTMVNPMAALSTAANAYKIQRPKIEAGKQIKIDDLWPKTIHNQTTLEILGHVYVKGLKGVPYYSGAATNLPRAFNPDNTGATDWASIIADETDDGFISVAPITILDTTVAAPVVSGDSELTLNSVAGTAVGHFIAANGLSSGTKIIDVNTETKKVKISMDAWAPISGNVRIYERPKITPSNTTSISGIGEVQLQHCINIFDFDPGVLGGDGSTNPNTNESYNPIWWPNQYHTPGFTLSMEKLAQYQAFADTQKHPHGKYLITSYQMWPGSGDYEGSGGWNTKRLYARLAAEAYPENFYDLAREVWVKAESWYQANYLTFYQQGWEKTFIQMGSGAIAGAPTSGTYSGGDPLMDGDLWSDDGTLYVLLLTTGDATHDAAQEAMFGGSHTLPTTTGQGIWIRVTGTSDSYQTLAGTGGLFWGATIAQGRSGVVGGVTYQGSAYDIARKSSPRIGRRDSAHSTYVHGRQFLGYLIGQELLRRGW